MAQLAVGQVEFADAVIVAGATVDVGTARRTDAVLDRLAPVAPRADEHGVGTVVFQARRPFHPGRLNDALQVLLHGVVRARGRMWVATQPDKALESAGGGLRIARAGPWLGPLPDWSNVDVERALAASLRWDARF